MASLAKMNRSELIVELEKLSIKWRTDRKSFVKWHENRKKQALKKLYEPNQDGSEIFFWSQDENGFPTHRISNSGPGVKVYPTVQLRHTIDAKHWPSSLPRPRGFEGRWPPRTESDLFPTADVTEECFHCLEETECDCDYQTWVDDWKDKWTEEFVLRPVKNMGYGIFSNFDFNENWPLGEFTGELRPMDPNNLDTQSEYKTTISIGRLLPQGELQPSCYIDPKYKGTVFRFLNHSCDPNAIFRQVRCGMNRRVIVVCARRDIKKGEQITIDYGSDFFTDENPCYCGAPNCHYPPESKVKTLQQRASSQSQKRKWLGPQAIGKDGQNPKFPKRVKTTSKFCCR